MDPRMRRLRKLEEARQKQAEGRPYTLTEGVCREQATPQEGVTLSLGFVTAKVTPRLGNPASVVITYDGRFLTGEEALDIIEARLPPCRSVYLFPDPLSVEEWQERFAHEP